MGYFSYVPGGTGTVERTASADQAWVDTQPNPTWWIDVTGEDPRPGPGWTYNGATFSPPTVTPTTRYRLKWHEWVETFTDSEWDWIDTERNTLPRTTATKALHKMLSKLKETNTIDVSATEMDPFYDWLLNNGLPGGQPRIDELRAGITE